MMFRVFSVFIVLAATFVVRAADNVSMISLISVPEGFNGKLITTSGVVKKNEEGVVSVYLDMVSAEFQIQSNAFVLLRPDAMSENTFDELVRPALDSYALIEAVFDVDPPKPRGYPGILRDVRLIRRLPLMKPIPHSQ